MMVTTSLFGFFLFPTKMSRRFLNVEYNNTTAEIDTNNMERFGQVQKAVEEWYAKDFPEVTALKVQLWNKTGTEDSQLDDLDDIKALPEDYYWKSKKLGSLFLTVQLLPSPVSRPKIATFQLFAWKATKNPFKTITLDLQDGRIYLRSLIIDEGFTELRRMDTDTLLQQGEDGYSIQAWQPGETYRLRFKKNSSVDIDVSFSEKAKEKMNIITVRDDFGICFDDTLWTYDADTPMKYPEALAETIGLFAEFNTLRLEPSRRSIVSLFLHYSISVVPTQTSKLCIDEETPLAIVRQVIRNGESKNIRYHGPVDFVIGHSKMLSTMPNDAAVLVIETKKTDTFDESLPQVVAQAAALLFFRREQKPPRGVNGSGGPIYFIRTDGERWIFSKLTCDEGFLKVQHSDEVKLNIRQNKIESETVQVIFDWLRYIITSGRDSSPRTSVIKETEQKIALDNSTLSAEFLSMRINID
jgi:hypothetical protein